MADKKIFYETVRGLTDGKMDVSEVPIQVLKSFDGGGPRPVQEVLAESGLGVLDFAVLVNKLDAARLIDVHGHGVDQAVELSPAGKTLVQYPAIK